MLQASKQASKRFNPGDPKYCLHLAISDLELPQEIVMNA
jgi:hypothetical protein